MAAFFVVFGIIGFFAAPISIIICLLRRYKIKPPVILFTISFIFLIIGSVIYDETDFSALGGILGFLLPIIIIFKYSSLLKKERLKKIDKALSALSLHEKMINSRSLDDYFSLEAQITSTLNELIPYFQKIKVRGQNEKISEQMEGVISSIQEEKDTFIRQTIARMYADCRSEIEASGTHMSAKFDEDTRKYYSQFGPETLSSIDYWYKELRDYEAIVGTIEEVDGMEGHAFEYWCADLLRKCGFSHVEVTPGSNDQGVDVTAEKGGIRYAIQCKCYASDLGNTPVQEVTAGKAMYRCQVGVVMTNRYFTAGARQLADANGILLWDRDKIKEMLEQTKNSTG